MPRLIAILLLVVLTACAGSDHRMTLSPDENALQVYWSGGIPIAISDVVSAQGYGSRIIIKPASSDLVEDQRISFYMSIYNYNTESVNVGPGDLEVSNSVGQVLPNVTAEQRRSEIRSEAQRVAYAQAIGAALQAYSTGYQASMSGQLPYQTSIQQSLQQGQARQRSDEVRRQSQKSLSLTSLYFGRTTIFPLDRYISFLDVYPPNRNGENDSLTLTVQVGSDTHVIPFGYTRQE